MAKTRVIISGGGTGGHVFPALAIAEALKSQVKEIEILFVGAEGKMEMEKVPAAGYKIIGLPIRGFSREISFSSILTNIKNVFRLLKSIRMANTILNDFRPQVVVGVGGYASGAILKAAAGEVPLVIQEQNSFAGLTNRLISKDVSLVCTAFDGMETFFPDAKIVKTGNPVRAKIWETKLDPAESREALGFDGSKPMILVMGGSGGAKSMNESMKANYDLIAQHSEIQWLWQTGKYYLDVYKDCETAKLPNVKATAFIDGMEKAYAASEVVIGRAGALTIAELCILKKASILIPSPNVTNDHQTHNAQALVDKEATILIADQEAKAKMVSEAIELVNNKALKVMLEENIEKLGQKDAAQQIATSILKLIQ